MEDAPVLSLLIANWNTKAFLQDLLSSIFSHRPQVSFEVIVIDNASVDGSAAMVETEYPEVGLVKNSENLGYARANNQAFRLSRGRLVLLLGSDTRIIDDSIQRMADHMKTRGDVGAIACRLLNPDRTPQGSCKRFPTLWDGVLTYLSLHMFAPGYNMRDFDFFTTQEVDQPSSTCLLIRRSILEQLGFFDARYFILYNDVDLCARIRGAGWRIIYFAEAEVVHHGSRSTTQAPPGLRLEMYRNILTYYHDRFGTRAFVILLPILALRLMIVNKGRRVAGLFVLGHLPLSRSWKKTSPRLES